MSSRKRKCGLPCLFTCIIICQSSLSSVQGLLLDAVKVEIELWRSQSNNLGITLSLKSLSNIKCKIVILHHFGELVKTQFSGLVSRLSDSASLKWGLRIGISNSQNHILRTTSIMFLGATTNINYSKFWHGYIWFYKNIQRMVKFRVGKIFKSTT